MLATYTRSSMREARFRLNPSDAELYCGIANEDRPNRLVLSGVYALPFGAGRAFGAGAAPVVSAVIGGWTSAASTPIRSGSPVTWGNVIYLGGDLNWQPRNIAGVRRDAIQPERCAAARDATSGRCHRTSPRPGSTPVSTLNMAICQGHAPRRRRGPCNCGRELQRPGPRAVRRTQPDADERELRTRSRPRPTRRGRSSSPPA